MRSISTQQFFTVPPSPLFVGKFELCCQCIIFDPSLFWYKATLKILNFRFRKKKIVLLFDGWVLGVSGQ